MGDGEDEQSDNAQFAAEKRYILAKPQDLKQYLIDRKKNYPTRANIERKQTYENEKKKARVLSAVAEPNTFRRDYEQEVVKGRIVMVQKREGSVVDRLIHNQQRREDSLLLEALSFIEEEHFLEQPIPKQYLEDYSMKPFTISFEPPRVTNHGTRSSVATSSSQCSSSEDSYSYSVSSSE